jgi:tetratricopeptide (TPR) repeat protein
LCCAAERGDDARAATPLLAVSGDSLRDARRREDDERACAVVASVIHESWRTTHLHPASGTYASCIKVENGVEYDITNLAFDALPPMIRAMNLATADAACAFIARSRDANEDLASAAWMEAASANQFAAHRDQGSYVADSDYPDVEAYGVLTRDRQEKYRAIVRIALRHYVADATPRLGSARLGSVGLSMLERAQQFSAAAAAAAEVAAAAEAANADEADAEDDELDASIVAPPKLLRSATAPAALRDLEGGDGSEGAARDVRLAVRTGPIGRSTRSGREVRDSATTTAGIAAEARAELMLRAVKPTSDADARVLSPGRRRKWRPVLRNVHATEDDSFALGHALLRKKLLAPVWVYFAAIPANLALRLVWTLSISPGISAYLGSEFFVLLIALLEILRRCVWNFFRLEHAQVSNWEGFQENRMTELGEAEELCRRTLYERHRVLGPDHSLTLTSLNNLGVVLHAQGKLSEAVPLLRSALEKKQATKGNDGTATLTVMTNLALLLEATGETAEAHVLLLRALRVYDETLGATHPSTLSFAHNLAELLQSHGESERAQPLFNRALLGTSEAWRVERNDSSLRRIPWHLSSSAIEYTVQGLVV